MRFLLAGFAAGILTISTAYAQQTQIDPHALVRRAVENDLNTHEKLNFRFVLRKQDTKGTTTKEIIETRDGDVARLIAVGDKPLPAEANQAELDRLNNLLAHPEVQEHRHKREQQDAGRADELVQVLPNAFVYKFTGLGEGPTGPVYKLSFEPNKKFEPPDYEARVFHGMAGELWIDQQQERVVRFDAHLTDDVEFGWGVLGRLFKGGTIMVEQADVGNHHWEQTHLRLDLTGKELLVKDLVERTTEDASNFQQVPNSWTYKDAIRELENNQLACCGAGSR